MLKKAKYWLFLAAFAGSLMDWGCFGDWGGDWYSGWPRMITVWLAEELAS